MTSTKPQYHERDGVYVLDTVQLVRQRLEAHREAEMKRRRVLVMWLLAMTAIVVIVIVAIKLFMAP